MVSAPWRTRASLQCIPAATRPGVRPHLLKLALLLGTELRDEVLHRVRLLPGYIFHGFRAWQLPEPLAGGATNEQHGGPAIASADCLSGPGRCQGVFNMDAGGAGGSRCTCASRFPPDRCVAATQACNYRPHTMQSQRFVQAQAISRAEWQMILSLEHPSCVCFPAGLPPAPLRPVLRGMPQPPAAAAFCVCTPSGLPTGLS